MNTKNKTTGAASVAKSETITQAVARFAKYREASDKLREASREASRKHAQLWTDGDSAGNRTRYNASMQAAAAAEAAALALTYCRETVRGMLAAETAEAYADIIGDFVGKSAGPKTCEKLYKAIAERLELRGFRGVRVWFGSLLYGERFSHVEASAEGLNGSEAVTIYGKYGDNGGGNELTDNNNRFNGRPLNGGKFEADERTPEQFAADFIAAENELEALRKECEAKRDEIAKRARFGSARPCSWHIVNDSREA